MHRWIDDGWMDGWMHGKNGSLDSLIDGMNLLIDGETDGWMDGYRWMNVEWLNG